MYGSQLLVPGATCSKSSKIYRRIGSEKLRAIETIMPHVWNSKGDGGGGAIFVSTKVQYRGRNYYHVNPTPVAFSSVQVLSIVVPTSAWLRPDRHELQNPRGKQHTCSLREAGAPIGTPGDCW